ncbi:MAG: hypothetical protein QM569_14390 [Acidovorax sp.]|uniref:hypothetical protein n=1 Tax=Acidovorax sp. TaxID=1872122 RepID=UPI0039E35DE7
MSAGFIDQHARRMLRTTAQAWGLPTPLRVRGIGSRAQRGQPCPLRFGFLQEGYGLAFSY